MDTIESELALRSLGHSEVSEMWRIKGTAEYANAAAH